MYINLEYFDIVPMIIRGVDFLTLFHLYLGIFFNISPLYLNVRDFFYMSRGRDFNVFCISDL